MAKQSLQRYIYKINSTRLRNAKWNLNINISEAIRNEELVSISESTTIRFIDGLNNTSSDQLFGEVKNIEKKIKNTKKLPTSIENRNYIKNLYKKKYNLMMVKDYVCIIIDSSRDFDRMNNKNGFYMNGVRFKRLLGTPGGIKKYVVVYVSEQVYDALTDKINNGRNPDNTFIPAKLEAYKSLACSASIPVSNPKGILVVHDCETEFKANVITIDDTQSDYPILKHEENYPIILNDSDGYGLISPELSSRWITELEDEPYIPSGYCIRNSFCKGMVFTFDFYDFAENVVKNYIVKDVWGTDRDIRDIELILTTSMLKLWDSYNSLEQYLSCCEDNGHTFSITKVTSDSLENERNLNYQFIQSLYLDDEGIDELIQPTIQEIHDILGEDYCKSILFLKGIHLDDMNFLKEENDFIKALMIDKRMINDPFVRSKIHFMIKKRITDAKIGVLKTNSNYSIVSGDPFSLCQSIFGMEVTGLLNEGEFYSQYWNDLNVDRVACFRAPMTCHNNIRILNFKQDEITNHWYQYMKTITIFNSWDTTAFALNGLDKDSDTVFTTDNPVILNAIRETDAIFCVQKSAEKVVPSELDFIQSNKDGFGDAIGITTNHITSMFDVLANFDEGSKEYEEIMYRIMCGQNYQQNAIDKIKGIVSKPMPKEWYDYWSNLDDEFNMSIVANKKPYFFIYIYPHRKKEYDKFIRQTNSTCLMRFGMTIDELIGLESRDEDQEKYLKYYFMKMPVSKSKSVMNKICRRIENEFDGFSSRKNETQFDSNILKTDKKYTKGRYNAIKKLYHEYTKKLQEHAIMSKIKRIDNEDRKIHKIMLREKFKTEAYELCNDAEELCNIVIDICYKTNVSKQFTWDICGDVIIDNLLQQNGYAVSYPVRDDNGDIEFGGNKFSMKTEEINIEDNSK